MKARIKVLVADDHPIMLNGLAQLLQNERKYEVIRASNGFEAYQLIRNLKPDVAVLDIEMPEMTGYEVAQKVFDEVLDPEIIFLTMYKDESMFNKALDVGVKGYVLKENTISEIITCLVNVLKGEYYISPVIRDFMIRRTHSTYKKKKASNRLDLLTKTEKNIIRQIALMKTSQEIADEFRVSIRTVQNHRNNICSKLGLSGSHALLKYAIEHASDI